MTFRALAILVTLTVGFFGVAAIVAQPDILPAAAAKLGEGGMWTALAAFVLGAAVLGAWPRDPGGRLRWPASRRR